MVGLSYGATSLFTTCSVLEIWWLKLQLKSCSEMGVPVLRPPECIHGNNGLENSYQPIPHIVYSIEAFILRLGFYIHPFGLLNHTETSQTVSNYYSGSCDWESELLIPASPG